MMIAALTKHPEVMLTPDESLTLAKALNRVAELYEAPVLDEKSRAWMGLSMVLFQVYGTRAMAAYMEAKKNKQPAPGPQAVPGRPAYTPPRQPITPIESYQEAVANGQA